MSSLKIPTARVFEPLLQPARFKGAKGGRGSGKSHFFAELLVEECVDAPGAWGEGMLAVCIREVQKTLAQSSKRLIESKIAKFGLGEADGFKVYNDSITTPGDGLITFTGMQSHNSESIKSLEGFRRALWDEAQAASEVSLSLLRPTIRAPGSELWFSWNPTRKNDAIENLLVHNVDALREELTKLGSTATVVTANWTDNPWWTNELEMERQTELRLYPERYAHTYGGEYAQAFAGAYFAALLSEAKRQGRICRVSADPLLPTRAYWDIGGAGATADAMAIWIVQFVGHEIRVLDYIEGIGQTLAYYVNELRERGWAKAKCFLPHDGTNTNNITGLKYKDHLAQAEFDVTVIPNQGPGAAKQRIEAVRRLFPKFVFNEASTEPGRLALGFYHEKRDDKRGIGLGPDHDWSSHCADAFGLAAIGYEEPSRQKAFNRTLVYPKLSIA